MRLVMHRGKWAASIDGRRYSTGLAAEPGTRAAAQGLAHEIAAALARRRAGDDCASIVEAYFADMPRRASPKQASESARYAARAALAYFGALCPAAVTREQCRAYVAARRAQGRSDGTIRKELSVLQAALNWRDPRGPQQFDFPAAAPPRSRFLSREELARLLAAAQDYPHVALFVRLAIATGARREALLALTWSTHIDFTALAGQGAVWPGFKAHGKGRARPIPMTPDLRAALEAAAGARTGDAVIEWAGAPVKSIRRALAAAYARAGIEDVAAPAHVLRHTAGAYMAMAGVPLLEIARRLGHSSTAVTERHYAHMAPDAFARSTAALTIDHR